RDRSRPACRLLDARRSGRFRARRRRAAAPAPGRRHRCLLAGALEVTVGEAPARTVPPGGAWFESGREPVLAVASPDEPTSFVRAAILPRAIRRRRSITFGDAKDGERGRPRTDTVIGDDLVE